MNRKNMLFTGIIIAVLSIAAGYAHCPEDIKIPVLLANGEVMTRPCYVTVDGENVALVDSEKTAEKVMEQVKSEYKNETTVNVRIREKTDVENMELENGDRKPDVLTENEAARQLVEEEAVTVETVEVVAEGTTLEYETVTTESDELMPGEKQVVQRGEDGFLIETKKIVKENGNPVSEQVIDEKVIAEAIPEIVISGTYELSPPLAQMRITSEFGPRWGRLHNGVDLGMTAGTPIYAAKAGTVTYAGYSGGFGNLVKIDHGGGMETYYAHCSSLIAAEGMTVEKGEIIAAVGSTGNSTGPHLHFEVRMAGQPCDPMQWIEEQ